MPCWNAIDEVSTSMRHHTISFRVDPHIYRFGVSQLKSDPNVPEDGSEALSSTKNCSISIGRVHIFNHM